MVGVDANGELFVYSWIEECVAALCRGSSVVYCC